MSTMKELFLTAPEDIGETTLRRMVEEGRRDFLYDTLIERIEGENEDPDDYDVLGAVEDLRHDLPDVCSAGELSDGDFQLFLIANLIIRRQS